MTSEIDLKKKVKRAFQSYPEPKGLLGIYPVGPLKMVDDSLGRCFRIYDGENKEFISISVPETKILPQEIKRYFSAKNDERQCIAKEEMGKVVNSSSLTPDELVATDIVESLRQWVRTYKRKDS